ncbi:MAG TPA: hypothetical protein PLZ51_07490, partial [Aggregatilineales bacterium]|nr:hypothetical protein [Aggregatilineales bacterium]
KQSTDTPPSTTQVAVAENTLAHTPTDMPLIIMSPTIIEDASLAPTQLSVITPDDIVTDTVVALLPTQLPSPTEPSPIIQITSPATQIADDPIIIPPLAEAVPNQIVIIFADSST